MSSSIIYRIGDLYGAIDRAKKAKDKEAYNKLLEDIKVKGLLQDMKINNLKLTEDKTKEKKTNTYPTLKALRTKYRANGSISGLKNVKELYDNILIDEPDNEYAKAGSAMAADDIRYLTKKTADQAAKNKQKALDKQEKARKKQESEAKKLDFKVQDSINTSSSSIAKKFKDSFEKARGELGGEDTNMIGGSTGSARARLHSYAVARTKAFKDVITAINTEASSIATKYGYSSQKLKNVNQGTLRITAVNGILDNLRKQLSPETFKIIHDMYFPSKNKTEAKATTTTTKKTLVPAPKNKSTLKDNLKSIYDSTKKAYDSFTKGASNVYKKLQPKGRNFHRTYNVGPTSVGKSTSKRAL